MSPCRGVVILLSSWWSLVSPDSKPQLPDGGGLRTVCRWPQSGKGPALPLLPGGQRGRQEQQELEAGRTRASDRVSVSLIQGSSLSLGSGSALTCCLASPRYSLKGDAAFVTSQLRQGYLLFHLRPSLVSQLKLLSKLDWLGPASGWAPSTLASTDGEREGL